MILYGLNCMVTSEIEIVQNQFEKGTIIKIQKQMEVNTF